MSVLVQLRQNWIWARPAIAVIAGAIGLTAISYSQAADEQTKTVSFATDIQPIFKQSCIKCHSLDNPRKQAAANFRLDTREAALKGGKAGHDIVPGKASDSLLYKLLQGPVKVQNHKLDPMPKAKRGEKFHPLSADKIQLIKQWIDQGAKWDE
jgi:hypothetical protein